MVESTIVKLRPVVHYREFPFGTSHDPSMREFMSPEPWEYQADVLAYLRSGYILGLPMGADLPDWFDASDRANPLIEGHREGGGDANDGWGLVLACRAYSFHREV